MFYLNKSAVLAGILLYLNSLTSVYAFKCYTCSTKSGDTYCGEDTFDGSKLPTITCPADADVCVRIRQSNDGYIYNYNFNYFFSYI